MEKLLSFDKRVILAGALLVVLIIGAIVVLAPEDNKESDTINPYEIIDRLEKRGYSVEIAERGEELGDVLEGAAMPAEAIEKIDLVIVAMNMELEELGVFCCFNDEKIAKECEKAVKDSFAQISASDDAGPMEIIVNRSGLIVYMGTYSVWKDAQ